METGLEGEPTDTVSEKEECEAIVPVVAFIDDVLAKKDLELADGQAERLDLIEMSGDFGEKLFLEPVGDSILGLIETSGFLSFDEDLEDLPGRRRLWRLLRLLSW